TRPGQVFTCWSGIHPLGMIDPPGLTRYIHLLTRYIHPLARYIHRLTRYIHRLTRYIRPLARYIRLLGMINLLGLTRYIHPLGFQNAKKNDKSKNLVLLKRAP